MNKKLKYGIFYIVLAGVLVLLDQWTKALTVADLKDAQAFELIPQVLELVYVENRGALFGIGQGGVLYFALLTPVCLAFVTYLFIKTPEDRKFWIVRACCMLVASGAMGNFIDRIFRGYVVDMIYFVPIDFPVFNVADCYVTVSVFLLFALLLFWKELGERMFPDKAKKSEE